MVKSLYISDGQNFTQITAADVGAAATSHTHNYAGSSSVGGAANSANKLATARTISLGGYSNGSATFDGSSNITITDNSLGVVKYVTTDKTTTPYYRVAYNNAHSSWEDQSVIMSVDSGYTGGGFGIVQFVMRCDNLSSEKAGVYYGNINWLVRYGFAADQFIMKVNSPASSTAANHYVDVYFKATGSYQSVNLRVLSAGGRGSNNPRLWSFTDGSSETSRAAMDFRTYSYEFKGKDVGTANIANLANSVAWNNVTDKPSTYTPSSHTHNYAASDSAGGAANQVKNSGFASTTNNVKRHIWISDASTDTIRVSDDNFTYNSKDNLVTANISGNAATATKATYANEVSWYDVSGALV